jgi:hypothetical protein
MPVVMPVLPAKQLIIDLAIRYGFQVLGALVILAVGVLLLGESAP